VAGVWPHRKLLCSSLDSSNKPGHKYEINSTDVHCHKTHVAGTEIKAT